MKKYLMFLSFAFTTLLTSAVIAEENKEEAEVEIKKEMVIDFNAPAALIDDEVISVKEVKDIYDSNQAFQAYPFEIVYPRLLEEIAKARVVKIAALKSGADKLPEVQEAIKEQTKNIAATYYIMNEIKKQETEENLMAFYKKLFQPEEEVKAKMIVVKDKKEAEEIIKKLKKGADFSKLADELSLDKSSNGGDVGYFKKNELGKDLQPFADAAFEIKKGEISKKPVKTFMGYHVIKIEDKRMTTPPAYENVKDDVIALFEKATSEMIVLSLIKESNLKTYPLTPLKEVEEIEIKEEKK